MIIQRRTLGYMRKWSSFLLLFGLAFFFLLPFFCLVSTAFKPTNQLYKIPFVWIPDPITLSNFEKGWNYVNFTRYTLNTVFLTVTGTIGIMFSSSLVAYGFARIRSRWSQPLFIVVLLTIMLPSQLTLVPSYILFSRFGLVDTYWPLLLPSWLGGGAFNIFLLRQFFRGIPHELDEAARMDGCTSIGIYFKIMLPVIKPALTSVGVMAIIWHWNDFLGPLVYLSTDSKYTVSIGLQYFSNIYGANKTNLLMAVSLVTLIPLLVLFFCAQRYFVQGITVTGIKG